jgi:hypothetical protein
MCKICSLSYHTWLEKYCHSNEKLPVFVIKLTVLEAKSVKIGLRKQLWQQEEQT